MSTRFARLAPWTAALIAGFMVVTLTTAQGKSSVPSSLSTPPTMRPLYVPMPPTRTEISCGNSAVPYSTDFRPSTGDTTYAARFKVSGSGTITLGITSTAGYTWQSISAPCDPCELAVDHPYASRVQIAVTAAADACPAGYLLLEELNTFVGP